VAISPAIKVELASQRKIRERNKNSYRFAHWPIWIWVFFIAPGPLTFDLFDDGFDRRMAAWLAAVLVGTGLAGLRGRLPGVEPRPYILRFTEDKPNPLYRRICYTFAWSAVAVFAILNLAGLMIAVVTGKWVLRQLYAYGYFPLALAVWAAGALPTPWSWWSLWGSWLWWVSWRGGDACRERGLSWRARAAFLTKAPAGAWRRRTRPRGSRLSSAPG